MRTSFYIISFLVIGLIILAGIWWTPLFLLLVIALPLFFMGVYDSLQTKHTIRKNFPLVGQMRYLLETVRPGVRQYFIESNIDGTPFNRNDRSLVYQRAKQELDTNPFGTQENVYSEGYEWINHSIAPKNVHELDHHPRVSIGGPDCKQPYSASIFNISAMSFGSLSQNAVLALNGGAHMGHFAHNTGEGGVSPYHLANGGDIIYQIGTGYFGCRAEDGGFSEEKYKITIQAEAIKMVELKLSQGAKPGHGGILPAKKNTEEIGRIRGVKPGTDVLSPPFHKAFSTPIEMMQFIKKLRDLSDGRPVGFKLCVGQKSEFIAICLAMIETGIKPDFIAVDGGEGGTGAAPLEFSDSVGMPFQEGLAFVHDTLRGYGLKKDIKLIAAGKIITSFDIFRAMALGADACYSARAMMMALGCIQARMCNTNHCPTGVATQQKSLMKGLVVSDKRVRVANYHAETVEGFMELVAATGLETPEDIQRRHIYQRINTHTIKRYDEIFPVMRTGSLAEGEYPTDLKMHIKEASAHTFDTQY